MGKTYKFFLLSSNSMASTTELLMKPRILGPAIKISFELYHALYPYHRNSMEITFGKRAMALFFVGMRWYRFLKDLIYDKTALNLPMTLKEKLALLAAILGHLLIIVAQRAT